LLFIGRRKPAIGIVETALMHLNDENMVKLNVYFLNKEHPEFHHYYKFVSTDVPLISFLKN
tara:strand:- start:766 stop:948 length:183 start_codon:yes stop_codon:yes gene_type:complete